MKGKVRRKVESCLLVCILLIMTALVAVCFGAASSSVNTTVTVSGLGSGSMQLSRSFQGTVPDAAIRGYRQLATADTNETVSVGDIATIEGMLLSCVDDSCDTTTGGLWVDCNSNSATAFSADLLIAEGESAYFKPLGNVEVVGANSVETPDYEFVIFGTR